VLVGPQSTKFARTVSGAPAEPPELAQILYPARDPLDEAGQHIEAAAHAHDAGHLEAELFAKVGDGMKG
jgi:hypothetical protein